MVHQSPDDISVNTVKSSLKVDEDCVQGSLPLEGLLDDDAYGCNVIRAGTNFSEVCLFIQKWFVQGTFQSLEDYSAQYFAGNRQQHDSSPVVAR